MAYADVKQILNDSPLMRHLWNKLNTEIVISCDGQHIRGILKTIDIHRKYIEMNCKDNVYFFNMRRIDFVKAKNIDALIKGRRS